MSAAPSISIIVSVRNAVATLEQCLESVLGQTYGARELIVIDGGSTDGSQDILQRCSSRIAYWVSEPDRGIYHAWNKGLAQAKGDWICFLGADDYLWEPRTLECIAPILAEAYPSTRVVYGQVALVNSESQRVLLMGRPWDEIRSLFPQIMCLPHTALMHHRSLFEQHGQFDESFRICGDYEMLLRELIAGEALFAKDTVVAAMGHGGVSSNPTKSLEMVLELRRAQRMHGLRRPRRAWVAAWLRAHIKVCLWRLLGPRVASRVFDRLRSMQGKEAYWTQP
jgi:glycosyltransferase involved in cell wall biosynthesis